MGAYGILIAVGLGSTPTVASAPSGPSLLVLPLAARGPHPQELAEQLTTALTHQVARRPDLRVTAFHEVEATLTQAAKAQVVGCDSMSCAVEIAAALDATETVFGSLGLVGDTWVIAVQRVRTRDATVLGRALEQVPRDQEGELLRRLPRMVDALFTTDARASTEHAPPATTASVTPDAGGGGPRPWWLLGVGTVVLGLLVGAAGGVLVASYGAALGVDLVLSGGRSVQGSHAIPLPVAAAATAAAVLGALVVLASGPVGVLGLGVALLGWVPR